MIEGRASSRPRAPPVRRCKDASSARPSRPRPLLGLGGLRLGRFQGGGLLLVALTEAIDAAGGVDELLRSRVKRVACGADVDLRVTARGSRHEAVAAGAVDPRRRV